MREVYLRAVDRKIQKDTAHAEWYSANGERVLTRMLDYMLGGEIPEDSGPWGERDEQALWTPYGLRSLSAADRFYLRPNAPGDAP